MSKTRPALTAEIVGQLRAAKSPANVWLQAMRDWAVKSSNARNHLHEVHAMHVNEQHADAEHKFGHANPTRLDPLIDDCRVCAFLSEQFNSYQF